MILLRIMLGVAGFLMIVLMVIHLLEIRGHRDFLYRVAKKYLKK